jgi:hypothetical protein
MTDETMSPAARLLKQIRDDNPDWTFDEVFEAWNERVLQDENLKEAFKDMWQRTNKRFQS